MGPYTMQSETSLTTLAYSRPTWLGLGSGLGLVTLTLTLTTHRHPRRLPQLVELVLARDEVRANVTVEEGLGAEHASDLRDQRGAYVARYREMWATCL